MDTYKLEIERDAEWRSFCKNPTPENWAAFVGACQAISAAQPVTQADAALTGDSGIETKTGGAA